MEVRLTGTSKNLEKGVIGNFTYEAFKGCLHVNNTSRKTIDKKTCYGKTSLQKRKGTEA
jgi:hypothetical protein